MMKKYDVANFFVLPDMKSDLLFNKYGGILFKVIMRTSVQINIV